MKEIYLGLRFSLSYFTILPITFKQTDDLGAPKILSSMLFFFPFVGVILVSVTLLLYTFLFAKLGIYGAVISSVIYMILYGFIHTEAILDVVDALYASHSGKNPYEVIKEPHIGAMGMLWGVGFVVIKVSLITYLLTNHLYGEFLAVAMISRFTLLPLIYFMKFKSSFVETLQKALTLKMIRVNLVFIAFFGYFLVEISFFFILFCGVLASFLTIKILKKKLGFLNGDTLGTTLELIEIILFLGIALLND